MQLISVSQDLYGTNFPSGWPIQVVLGPAGNGTTSQEQIACRSAAKAKFYSMFSPPLPTERDAKVRMAIRLVAYETCIMRKLGGAIVRMWPRVI